MKPLPHSIKITRPKWRDRNKDVSDGIVDIATGVKGLISPASVAIQITPGGPAEILRDLIFLEPSADVEVKDILINETTGERWLVIKPPVLFENPITWEADHWEATVTNEFTG
jgi:hypothetical protein